MEKKIILNEKGESIGFIQSHEECLRNRFTGHVGIYVTWSVHKNGEVPIYGLLSQEAAIQWMKSPSD